VASGASASGFDFVSPDDDEFGNILSMLDENIFEIVPDFSSEVEVSARESFPCQLCKKVCLSKGGLTRH